MISKLVVAGVASLVVAVVGALVGLAKAYEADEEMLRRHNISPVPPRVVNRVRFEKDWR